MRRPRHTARAVQAVPVSTLLARKLTERPDMPASNSALPGQRLRMTFDNDGTPRIEPYPVFSGDLDGPDGKELPAWDR